MLSAGTSSHKKPSAFADGLRKRQLLVTRWEKVPHGRLEPADSVPRLQDLGLRLSSDTSDFYEIFFEDCRLTGIERGLGSCCYGTYIEEECLSIFPAGKKPFRSQ